MSAENGPGAEHKPLNVGQLMDALGALLLNNPDAANLPVVFGIDTVPICGGALQPAYLNLAPMPLGRVGGF